MRFLFVSNISAMSDHKIAGQVEFGSQEPWQRQHMPSGPCISTSVVSEAVGQLVSWLSLRNNNFTARPVFLFATRIGLSDDVAPGTTVDLAAEITDQSSESFIFSGTAKIAGRTVVTIEDCGGYLMPLQDLENPADTRARFLKLISTGLPANPGSTAFDYRSLIDEVVAHESCASVVTRKVFSDHEPFYPDHFPRYPVTPIVVINEMIAEATAAMMSTHPGQRADLKPIAVQDLKIKSFLRPGDQAQITVKNIETIGKEFETIAEIIVNGRRILRGRYRYELC